mgnify:CR=1 FL=1
MPPLIEFLFALNIFSAVLLAVYALHQAILLVLFLRTKTSLAPGGGESGQNLPRVTVQLPLFNERYVAERIIAAACALDYPRELLHIQVLDDSTDDTRQIAIHAVQAARAKGHAVELIQRPSRDGFKAGALREGLQTATGEFIAIFDADFIPQPDFLRRTLAPFADERVGFVQTRWGFLNRDQSAITRGQAAMLNMHFVTEQTARSANGLVMNFNGSGGVWRRSCILDAGNWQGDCLSEDLDLSIRAETRGWRGVYLNRVESPGELPDDVNAFKRQQKRWARGSSQVMRKLLAALWRSPLSLAAKVMATLHLSGYVIHIFVLVLALTTPILALSRQPVPAWVGFASAVGAAPALSMFAANIWLGRRARDFARDLPFAIMLGLGVSVSNAAGLVMGFASRAAGEWTRTPKAAPSRAGAGYTLQLDWSFWCEAGLALVLFAAFLALLAMDNWTAAATCALYAFSFGGVALAQARVAWQGRTRVQPVGGALPKSGK